MRSIIRQRNDEPGLPELRNLGTILRILLAVNGAAALVALARAPSLTAFAGEWTTISGVVEPHLLLELAVLWVLASWLAGLPFAIAAAAIAGVGVAVAFGVEAFVSSLVPQAGGVYATHVVFTLAATALLLAYFRLRAKALSPAISEARLQALQARIRPHFLFNSINGVMSLVRSDPRRAEEALHDMADLFRVLMRDNRELAPLADEVELCRQYLDLEKLRLGDRLDVDWNVKSMPADALVPPLLLQPLLENAVYHGIEPSSTPGTISINIFLSRSEVHAILRNPYDARAARHQRGNRMAIANIRERLALHFDAEARLESRVLPDAYEVHIRLPYRTATPPQPADRVEPRAPRADSGPTPGARRAGLGLAGAFRS
ncbi:MAG TPA: histidine kinase [Casimicrobiaceae bacterium]|jgi:two-component system sensor histidine kinase AlgZ